jgi:mono/diheme cytochrome c family protein
MSITTTTALRRIGVPLGLLCGVLLRATPLLAQETERDTAVTVERVEQGLALYHGKGACDECHGSLGTGTPDGPGLLTGQWKLGPGTFLWLQQMTRHGGWGTVSRGSDPQRMRGPTVLDSAEVSAVAAYVWSISRGKTVGMRR